jgi:hypothetical protein
MQRDRDAYIHLLSRLGQIRSELASMNEQLADLPIDQEQRPGLVIKTDRVRAAAEALSYTARGDAITDELISRLLDTSSDDEV